MKVAFVSLGCAKNLVNTEQMMALVRSAGHEITAQPEGADAAVLNTCGFIDSAKSEAIQNILELAELKKEGKLGKLLVTGCLSQRYQDELMEELPEVDGVMGTGSYTEIVPALEELMAGGTPHRFGDIDHTEEDGARIPATPSYTAYLKIAEGCDHRCAFCIIPKLRDRLPGLVLRTSLICGLPGEGKAEFEELCEFLREARIERAGIFQFSPEEGTPAAEMGDQVDAATAERRVELVVELQSRVMDAFNGERLGECLEVRCEGFDGEMGFYVGRTYADSPDVDGKVYFTAGGLVPAGAFVWVRITGTSDGDLTGEIEE